MKYGNYRTLVGNATEPQMLVEGRSCIIPHVSNNVSAWGSGFTFALTNSFPEAKDDFYTFNKNSGPLFRRQQLGHVILTPITKNIPSSIKELVVASMIAQDGIGSRTEVYKRDNPFRPCIRYSALVDAMLKVVDFIQNYDVPTTSTGGLYHIADEEHANQWEVHAPRFGSLRSAGNWEIIEELIKEIWCENGIDVTVYEWTGTP